MLLSLLVFIYSRLKRKVAQIKNTSEEEEEALMAEYDFPPNDLPPVLLHLSREVMRHQPTDIVQFCADYFNKLLMHQRAILLDHVALDIKENLSTPVSGNILRTRPSTESTFTPPQQVQSQPSQQEQAYANDDDFGSDDDEEILEDTVPVPVLNRGRRTSVSAESMAPTSSDIQIEKLVIPKTDMQRTRIQKSVANNFLFRNLDEEQYVDVVNAMAEKRVTSGETVIRQGGVGDYFYVVETGTCDVYVNRNNGAGDVKVFDYGPGGSFGELALMYNAPRAATIRATSECVLWALDRITFRRILMDHTSRKRRMYESFLEEVQLLASLEPYERHKIADALESVSFNDGDIVIKQGDLGDNFYIIEAGEADVVKVDEMGVAHTFKPLRKGCYFGELALLSDKPRLATIRAKGRLKCATLGKKAFTRLLGPLTDIMERNTQDYEKYPGENSNILGVRKV